MTGRAGILDLLASTLTAWTGLLHREEALLHAHLTVTTTSSTVDRRTALLRAAAITGVTCTGSRDANLHRRALHGFLEI